MCQSVGSGLSLEPPATTEADEEEDGMSDIIQEVNRYWKHSLCLHTVSKGSSSVKTFIRSTPGHRTDLESGSEGPGGQEAPAELQASPGQCRPVTGGF